jgi:hypothetical protein
MWEPMEATIGEAHVQSTWYYNDGDPYAIHILFHLNPDVEDVHWVFSRETLHTALNDRIAGLADIVWIIEDHIARLVMSSPDGKAEILFNREQVENFFNKTLDTVPLGEEDIDIDNVVLQLLKGN